MSLLSSWHWEDWGKERGREWSRDDVLHWFHSHLRSIESEGLPSSLSSASRRRTTESEECEKITIRGYDDSAIPKIHPEAFFLESQNRVRIGKYWWITLIFRSTSITPPLNSPALPPTSPPSITPKRTPYNMVSQILTSDDEINHSFP